MRLAWFWAVCKRQCASFPVIQGTPFSVVSKCNWEFTVHVFQWCQRHKSSTEILTSKRLYFLQNICLPLNTTITCCGVKLILSSEGQVAQALPVHLTGWWWSCRLPTPGGFVMAMNDSTAAGLWWEGNERRDSAFAACWLKGRNVSVMPHVRSDQFYKRIGNDTLDLSTVGTNSQVIKHGPHMLKNSKGP